jgi:SHS2 domain-containing protein
MPYRWIDDLTSADLALEAAGADLAEVFRSAWEATVAAMLAEGETPSGLRERELALEAASQEELLYELLEKVVYVKDTEGILLVPQELTLAEDGAGARLAARAICVPVEAVLERLVTDVKAVTLHHFSLERVGGLWRATVVLDV